LNAECTLFALCLAGRARGKHLAARTQVMIYSALGPQNGPVWSTTINNLRWRNNSLKMNERVSAVIGGCGRRTIYLLSLKFIVEEIGWLDGGFVICIGFLLSPKQDQLSNVILETVFG
jgi:hypothetical protein